MHLNITIKESIRNLKPGNKYEFDFKDNSYFLIAGKNGAGKSTLINVLRDFQCDNKSDKTSDDWNIKLGFVEIRGFKNKADIDTDFNKFFFLSSEFDDPLALNNSASCSSFIKHGGYHLSHKSNGERNFQNLGRWLEENQTSFDDKTLLVFDEADKGFELKFQVGFINMMKKLNEKYGCKSLCITHNVIPMTLSDEVYMFDYRKFIPSRIYLLLETGYEFKIEKAQ